MIIEKKVCFILNWAREFNMYETLINQLKKKILFLSLMI